MSDEHTSNMPSSHGRITHLHVEAAKLALAKHGAPTPTDLAIRDMIAAAASLDAPPPSSLSQAMIDRVAAAIKSADFGYSMRQIRLVDGINTYALTIDGKPTEEFTDNDDASASDQCYARIREVKQRKQAEAVIAALVAPAPSAHVEGKAEARDAGISFGIAISVAYLIRDRDEPTIAREWWDAAGLTIEQCERIGVDEYDLEPIRAALATKEGKDNG